MTGEALACFTSLLEDVPGWIAELEGILRTAGQRQEDLLLDDQAEDSTPILFLRKALSKSSSLKSRRSRPRETGSNAAQLSQVKKISSSDALRLSSRKRKPASSCSGGNSGPVKLRSKAVATVYYDGETQKQFERIVRTVGSARNQIRKGKMAAKVDSLSRASSSCSDMSSDGEDELSEFSPSTFRLDYKSTRGPRPLIPFRRDDTESFDKVDSCLEKAQSACEKAAHQVLREGDCTSEVTSAKDHFRQALHLSEAEMPLLRKKAEKVAAREKRKEERRLAEAEAEERRRSDRSHASEKMLSAIAANLPTGDRLNIDLEVDDDSDEGDAQFNVSALRGKYGSFAQMRSSRLTTH